MDELRLPEKHWIALILRCFLDFGGVELLRLFLFDFVDLTEGTTAQFLDDLEAALQDFLAVCQHAHLQQVN